MEAKTSLRDLEKDLFRKNYQDGILEISVGWIALFFVIALLLSPYLGDFWSSVVILPFWGTAYLILRTIRTKLINPRIGEIEFSPSRKKKMLRANYVMLAVNLIALVLGILSFIQFNHLPGWVHTARFSLVILIGFSLAGYLLDFSRAYLYGLMLAAAPLTGEYLYQNFGASHHGFPITFGFVAGILFLIGLIKMISLLMK